MNNKTNKTSFQKGNIPKHPFKKGHIPWSKGTKGIQKPNSGSFKKGHIAKKIIFTDVIRKKMSDAHKFLIGEKHPGWKGGKPNCKICGKKLTNYNIEYCHKCGSKGENNPNWKGGITPLNQIIRTSLEYKLWRIAVFERDNYTCIWCGEKEKVSSELNAHHIKSFAYFPELRFAIDNGRTLCEDCHKTTDNYLWKGKR